MGIRTKKSLYQAPGVQKDDNAYLMDAFVSFVHLSAGWQGSLNGVVQLIKNSVRTLAWSTNPHRGRGES